MTVYCNKPDRTGVVKNIDELVFTDDAIVTQTFEPSNLYNIINKRVLKLNLLDKLAFFYLDNSLFNLNASLFDI